MPLCVICKCRQAEKLSMANKISEGILHSGIINDPELDHHSDKDSTTVAPPNSPQKPRGRGRPKTIVDYKDAKRNYNRTYYVKKCKMAKEISDKAHESQTLVI